MKHYEVRRPRGPRTGAATGTGATPRAGAAAPHGATATTSRNARVPPRGTWDALCACAGGGGHLRMRVRAGLP